ncbi:MJ1255/VC2487 family glycosyltransferase [Aeromonas cavernicola]|uniref:Glycosyltransferase n=1 Tax=Aeromonas cavernicola TaxID=1006623 RepID=A0A2H9U3L0_9GAMM|nr:MJ1255/VC2487 family glycosyltransferase [Aeromonas cavernicola]PJG58601.1 glycosyltransferase [Aeromonas cavernicola]
MKVLFGVQGTGNGHISRSRTLARALRRAGVSVDYLFSGRPADGYFDMEEFGAYRTFPGLTFVSHEGKVSPWRTLQAASPLRFWRDLRALDCREYDLIVSDFEPLTAHAARRLGKPSLTISHQASFNWSIPRWGEDGVSRQLMRYFAPVSQPLGLHWFHFGYPLLPPVIDAITPAADNGAILVYLPFEHRDAISALLSRFNRHTFICFHPGVQSASQWRNIRFEPPCRAGFLAVLAGCRGVISNAGFELASEALSLGKKLLVKPLGGQFEQLTNGKTLELMGLATLMDCLDANIVRTWLDSQAPGVVCYPNVAAELADWLVAGGQESVSSLSRRLWARTLFPEEVSDRLSEFVRGETVGNSWLSQVTLVD